MRRLPRALLVALFTLVLAAPAHAESPSTPRSRIYAGHAFGLNAESSLKIDDRQQLEEGGDVNLTFTAGYLQRLLPNLGLALSGGIGSASTLWSSERGEVRTRAQLTLGPAFVGTLQERRPNIEWRISVPVGYTRTWINPGDERGVEESYSPASGGNLSLVVGIDIFGTNHGGYIDAGYALHLTWLTHTATLKSHPSVKSQQAYRYFDRTMLLGGGYVYRF